MRTKLLPAAVATVLLLASGARGDAGSDAPAGPSVSYRVRTDAALERMEVHVCFEGAPPPSLGPGIEATGSALLAARGGDGHPLPVRDRRIDLRSVPPDGCVVYELDLDAALRASRLASRYGDDVVSSQGAWLWRDRRRPPRGGARVRFELPDGLRAATPWPIRGRWHLLGASAFQRPAFVALGRFTPTIVERQQARVAAVRLGDGWALDDDGVRDWLTTAIDGVATVQGRFPVDSLLVVLVPSGGQGMGFGMVRRGGGPSVAFVTGRRSRAEDLERSWVSWHELSHLQLPAMPQRDAWLYEGLATYYQEVLPARMGIQTEREAWADLADGFDRGARNRSRRPLAREAAQMRRTGAFQRVYWAGTAFALEADVRLRRRGRSLDAALARGGRTWRDSHRVWSGEEVCGLWDRPFPEPVLRPLHARYRTRRDFPAVDPLLRRLGVRGDGHVRLREGELSALRDAITRRVQARRNRRR